jgi:hypothetical protein
MLIYSHSPTTNQWMKNPCSHKWYVTIDVIVHATWIFLQLVVFCHLSKATKILSFSTKIVVIYFQISFSITTHGPCHQITILVL